MRDVVIKYKDRTVLLQLKPTEDESEYSALLREFGNFTVRDLYFSNKTSTHYAVFEYYHSEFKCNIELPLCDVLPSSTIFVKMCAIASPVKAQTMTDADRGRGTTPSVIFDEQVEGFKERETEKITALGNDSQEVTDINNVIVIEDQRSQEEITKIPTKTRKMSDENEDSSANHKFTIDNFPMPKFSKKVLNIVRSGDILIDTQPFVKEAAEHLISIVTSPSHKIYNTYTTALMLNYPELDVVADPVYKMGDLLRDGMKNYVKNNKNHKPVPAGQRKRGSILSLLENRREAKKRKVSLEQEVEVSYTPINNFQEFERLLSKKKFKPELLIHHLPTFMAERREKLSEFETISDLIKDWPCFSHRDVIKEEFFLREQLTNQDVKSKFEAMLKILSNMLNMPISSELEKILLLAKLEEDVYVQVGKNYPKAFTVLEITNPKSKPRMPNTVIANAPIAVIYSSGSNISNVFLRAENKNICSLDELSAVEIYKILVGSYYAYHRDYPIVSKNLFDFLDFSLLGKSNHNTSTKYATFLKKYVEHTPA